MGKIKSITTQDTPGPGFAFVDGDLVLIIEVHASNAEAGAYYTAWSKKELTISTGPAPINAPLVRIQKEIAHQAKVLATYLESE